jgi:hypothetical protein
MTKYIKAGRLALRGEAGRWNAYWALPNTMQGALFLGSIPLAAINAEPDLKEKFIELMRETVTALIPGATWPDPPHAAPEHERGGNA